jgi:DNA-binding transcriptional MerR regulator
MVCGVQIGKVARSTGLSVDTIRFYEKEGLLREPERSEGGSRLYSSRRCASATWISFGLW